MLSMDYKLSSRPGFDVMTALQKLKPHADWVGIRYLHETTRNHMVRNEKPESHSVFVDEGAMIEVLVDGQFAYAGSSQLTDAALFKALERAKELAKASAKYRLHPFSEKQRPKSQGSYSSPRFKSSSDQSLAELLQTLKMASKALKVSEKISTAESWARILETQMDYANSSGAEIRQNFLMMNTSFSATATNGSESQTRSESGGLAKCNQIGFEVFDRNEILRQCERIGREALELLAAPNCPSEKMDLILAPDQMLLQIHESIGHPLELDRILGDERNYAGWSFVKPSDFGSLQYGSELMNVSFDPSYPGEFASYAFDDCGNPATKEFLIKKGKLLRGLGSLESQARSGLPGVANFRSSSWNRAPIDRMANINLEPGNKSLQEMIAGVEKGIFMRSNVSWSIDDYRNKFQFGCEYAQLIEDGRLTKIVKNPNYRGITVPFWNSLKAVGKAEEFEIYGSPWCGKGEPNQVIRVGHGSPPCLFENVEVFGGLS